MTDTIRQSLAAGTPALGAWISMGETQSIDAMGQAGYDFLILDIQHGAITWDRLLPAIQVLGTGVAPLIRVGWRDQAQIMRAVDLGAAGVIVPMVSTAEEARQAVAAIRYPPAGIRSFGPIHNYYSSQSGAVEPLCFVMIETAEALRNLDAIASTPGINGLFVGPMDLALSLGESISMKMSQAVLDAIGQVVGVCQRHDIIAGSASLGMSNAEELLRLGVRLVSLSSDMLHLRRGAQAEVEQCRMLKQSFVSSAG
jgi:4-hydroxy-2-oxoheptanedioate aldolase